MPRRGIFHIYLLTFAVLLTLAILTRLILKSRSCFDLISLIILDADLYLEYFFVIFPSFENSLKWTLVFLNFYFLNSVYILDINSLLDA